MNNCARAGQKSIKLNESAAAFFFFPLFHRRIVFFFWKFSSLICANDAGITRPLDIISHGARRSTLVVKRRQRIDKSRTCRRRSLLLLLQFRN